MVRSSLRGCHENKTELEVYQLLDTIQMMQMGVAQSKSTIWMTENSLGWYWVVAAMHSHIYWLVAYCSTQGPLDRIGGVSTDGHNTNDADGCCIVPTNHMDD